MIGLDRARKPIETSEQPDPRVAMPSGYRNFLIVGTQRTGSQALYDALNLHPDVVCLGELTHHVSFTKKLRAAELALNGDLGKLIEARPKDRRIVSERLTDSTTWLGFKILFRSSDKWLVHPRWAPALLLDRIEDHLAWLGSRPDVHVIQLIRRDSVEWLKSKYLARETGRFMNKEYPSDLKVRIPLQRALRSAEAKAWVDKRLTAIASTNPYHRVYYEDFLRSNREVLESCLGFLHCDKSKLPEDARFINRQSTKSAADYISNYTELDRLLSDRQLRQYRSES